VPEAGLEPARFSTPGPKPGAPTNYAIPALSNELYHHLET
jgi:hypothetical protein